MKQGYFETLVGFIVIFIAIAFFIFAYNKSEVGNVSGGYKIIADFENIDGISEGTDVKMAGIKIGNVESIILDKESFYAKMILRVNSEVLIPKDSRVIVSTSGILGGKYIRIAPGSSEENIKENGVFVYTQSALNIEDLISKLLYSFTSK